MNLSNTHLLGELTNVTGSTLKEKRMSDIQNVADDKYSNADGDSDAVIDDTVTDDTQSDTENQAKDVVAKEHAKKEPIRVFGVHIGWIIGGVAVIGGGFWAYNKYFKK